MTTLILSLIARFGPYGMILLGIGFECIAMRRDWNFGGPFAAILACLLMAGGGVLLGRASK